MNMMDAAAAAAAKENKQVSEWRISNIHWCDEQEGIHNN